MQLRLTAQAAYANETPPPIHAAFDTQGGTLGRDPRCHMVLVDPLRRISRIQAQIVWEGDAFHLINASTSNPIYVNGRELGPGARSVIGAREEWRTGNYLIEVEQAGHGATVPVVQAAMPQQAMPPVAPQVIPQEPLQMPPAPAAVEPLMPEPAPPMATPAMPMASAPVVSSPASMMNGPFDDLLATPVNTPGAAPMGAFDGLGSPAPAPLPHSLPDPLADRLADSLPDPLATPSSAGLPGDPFATPVPATAHQAQRAPLHGLSVGDPFADLMGAPIDAHVSSAPANRFAPAPSGAIPDDFNPMALGGVSHRNDDDPLKDLLQPGSAKDMFPERSLDAIFQPAEGSSIDSMTVDPLQAAHHQSFMDASSKVDPLAIFSQERTEDSLNPEMLFSGNPIRDKTQSDHTSELGSYFRAPRALQDPAQEAVSAPHADLLQAFTAAADPIPFDPAPLVSRAQPQAIPPDNHTDLLANIHNAPAGHSMPSAQPEQAMPLPSPGAVNLDSLFDLGAPSDAAGPLMNLSPTPAQADPHAATSGAAVQPQQDTTPIAATPEMLQPAVAADAGVDPLSAFAAASPTQAEPASTPSPTPIAAATIDNDQAQQLLDAFKRGAGLHDCRFPQQLTPEMMHMVGQMLAASVQGCMDLLGSRAATKQEVRIAVTLINAEANNPLKFLPTGASALAQIFGPKMPGFLTGPAAIENAYLDLRAHEVGMMAGTQAAVQGLFERFDPQEIEHQLDALGKQRTLFAAQRSARLWEMYCSRYQWLKDEMKNQTPASWGTEFHSAYQSEMDSIDSKGPKK